MPFYMLPLGLFEGAGGLETVTALIPGWANAHQMTEFEHGEIYTRQ